MRTVFEQDVYTALYGFGAGLFYTDAEGNYVPDYRRKLTFVSDVLVASPMDARGRGIVDASIMLSLGDGRHLSTRDFRIRAERALIDGLEPEDGFTLFVQAIAAYEEGDRRTAPLSPVPTPMNRKWVEVPGTSTHFWVFM